MSLFFQNFIFQIFIPFCQDDIEFNQQGQDINFKVIPPFIDKSLIAKFGSPDFIHVDLSDEKTIKGEKQSVTLLFDKLEFK